jgi:hypothetical protein
MDTNLQGAVIRKTCGSISDSSKDDAARQLELACAGGCDRSASLQIIFFYG